MFYSVEDYSTRGANALRFARYYNSRSSAYYELGNNWTSTFDRFVLTGGQSSPHMARVARPDGKTFTFTLSGGAWVTDADVDYTLTQSGSSWTLTTPEDTAEVYTTPSGFSTPYLQSITERNGYTQTLSYSGNRVLLLQSVTDSYGRSLNFTYNSHSLLATVSTPDGMTLSYSYLSGGGSTGLASVTYPTSPLQSVTYGYGTGSTPPNALISVTDEAGNPLQNWTYDAYGRGLTSYAGGSLNAGFTQLTYNDATGTRTVSNAPVGANPVVDTYSFTTIQNVPKITGINRAATSNTAAASRSFTYNASGYMTGKTDWNGNLTRYSNIDSHGQPGTIVEAYGTPVARTTTIAYTDASLPHSPTSITTQNLLDDRSYTNGNLTYRVLIDQGTQSVPYSTQWLKRVWSFTYTPDNLNLRTIQTPKFNTTTFTYTNGALTGIKDALNHTTTISNSPGGLPQTITDPNGMVTRRTYDARLRPASITTSESGYPTLTTTLLYFRELSASYPPNPADLIITNPDGSATTWLHDNAQRVTQLLDAYGNQKNWALNILGDATARNITGSGASTPVFARTAGFDALGRKLTDTSAVTGASWVYTYDANGNPP